MTHIKTHTTAWIAGAVVLLAAAGWGFGQDVDLTGRVQHIDKPGQSLDKRIEAAGQEFRREHREGLYMAGYVFPARDRINMGDRRTPDTRYQVQIKSGEIKIRRTYQEKNRDRYSVNTELDGSGPAGIFLLYRMSDDKSRIVDSTLFDPDRSFAFEDAPLYWLGETNAAESFAFLTAQFESSGEDELQTSLILVISLHDSPKATPFLKGVALGGYATGVRKNAILWIGILKSPEGYRALKDIAGKVQGTELRKQVVFAYSLSGEEEAIQEMLRIARQDKDREVRKNAIFWLGQKASDEAALFLKDVVEGSDEDEDIKKSALFAISQLPKDQSVPLLISIARSNQSAAVRKNAIFWLGQTGEEEALQFFEEILLKKQPAA
ncbi:MAG: HEAT repeat domain-containing protein [Candidatus Aminicenantaceae bacterium]